MVLGTGKRVTHDLSHADEGDFIVAGTDGGTLGVRA
jgi:hypothetical protein